MEFDIKAVIEESRKPMALPTPAPGGKPGFLIPAGFTVLDTESLLPAPVRKRAAVTLNDTDSFIEYTKKHGSLDNCTIYADTDFEKQTATLIAIVNDHGSDPADTSWRDHTATYRPIQTVEWKRWNGSSGKSMDQEAFATFLEENMVDIANVDGMPTGTDMLKMASEFEATCDKRFKSRLNIQGGGVNLLFVDQDNPETEQRMRVFERFSLGVRVFLNGTAYQLDARLKYRHSGGKLSFWYELIRADRVFEDAIKAEFVKVKSATGFPLLYGNSGK
jgi:uncharacterized protein YfdQ (DUF2303 family)